MQDITMSESPSISHSELRVGITLGCILGCVTSETSVPDLSRNFVAELKKVPASSWDNVLTVGVFPWVSSDWHSMLCNPALEELFRGIPNQEAGLVAAWDDSLRQFLRGNCCPLTLFSFMVYWL